MRNLFVLGVLLAAACGGGDDTAANDGGKVADGAIMVDSGGTIGYATCGNGTAFVDRTGASDDRTITVTGTSNFFFSPRCMQIKKGQTVTWMQDLAFHPLNGAPTNPGNEIHTVMTGQMTTATLNEVGFYGYYCGNHGTIGGSGLSGSIQVIP